MRNTNVTVRLDFETRELLERIARDQRRKTGEVVTASSVVRDLIFAHLPVQPVANCAPTGPTTRTRIRPAA